MICSGQRSEALKFNLSINYLKVLKSKNEKIIFYGHSIVHISLINNEL